MVAMRLKNWLLKVNWPFSNFARSSKSLIRLLICLTEKIELCIHYSTLSLTLTSRSLLIFISNFRIS